MEYTEVMKTVENLNDIIFCDEDTSEKNVQLFFPLDYQIAHKTLDGTLETVSAENLPVDGIGVSIGPKTILHWSTILQEAKTVFFNAAMGFTKRPETLEGLRGLLHCVAHSNAHTVVGGGDSVAAVERFGLTKKINFLSTGGGATLAYLSGEQLPGLKALT